MKSETLPPHNKETERAFLGSLLMCESPEGIDDLIVKCEAEFFYSSGHQRIFNAIQTLRSEGKTPNLMIVTDCLREKGLLEEAGGGAYISSLPNLAALPSLVPQYLDILIRDYQKRILYNLGLELIDKAQNGSNPIELANMAKKLWKKSSGEPQDCLRDGLLKSTRLVISY